MFEELNNLPNGKKVEFKKIGKSIYKIVLSNYKGQKNVQFYKQETDNTTAFESKDFNGFPKVAKDNGEFIFERGDKFTVIKWTPSIACLKSEANLNIAFNSIIHYIENFGNPVLNKKVCPSVKSNPVSVNITTKQATPFKDAIIKGNGNSKVKNSEPVKPLEEEISIHEQEKQQELHKLIKVFQRSTDNMEENHKMIENFNSTISSLETQLANAIKLVAELPKQIEGKKAELLEIQKNEDRLKTNLAEAHTNITTYLSAQAGVWE